MNDRADSREPIAALAGARSRDCARKPDSRAAPFPSPARGLVWLSTSHPHRVHEVDNQTRRKVDGKEGR
jgi:hypothetical protein